VDSGRWDQIQTVFLEAVARPEPERMFWLESACGADRSLMSQVLAMLKADYRASSLLDRGLPDVAYQTVGTSFDPIVSREFGPYRLKEILGEGGMGVVWLAERVDAGNPVAIKFLPHAGLSPARRERFAEEIKTLAKLKHPFIARLYDAGTLSDGTPWFVMEYVEGVDLTHYCQQKQRSVKALLRLFRSVCEAVRYAHGQEIIHRDLKPSNIMVETDGTPKLLDFGIAKKLLNMEEQSVERTNAVLRFMSRDYAAPEWAGDGTVGPFTDVYSLGVILYSMLTGRLPFETAEGSPKTWNSRAESNPERPSLVFQRFVADERERKPWERRELGHLCLKAMHRDAKERYQSVEALIRDIDHYLNGEPLEARPDTLRYRARKFVGRHRVPVMAASLAFTLIVAISVLFTARLAKERNAALAQAARVQRIETFMTDLFQGADDEAGPSEDLKVATLLDRGAKAAQLLNNDPQAQIDLYRTVGSVYETLGQLEKADTLLQSALEESRRVFGADHEETGRSLLKLGYLRDDEGKPQEAEQLIRSGLAIYKKRNVSMVHPDVGEAMAILGWELDRQGKYDEAKDVLTEDVRLNAGLLGQKKVLSSALSYLGTVYYHQGQYTLADYYNQRSIDVDRQFYGPKHPSTAVDLMNFAMTKMQRGQSKEAEAQYREAASIYRNWYGDRHPLAADSADYVARALMDQGRYDEAAPILKHSLDTLKTIFGSRAHATLAFANGGMGIYCLAKGKFQEAEEHFKEELRIEREMHGDHHPFVGVALMSLGDVHLKSGDLKAAEDYLRQALMRLSGTSDPAFKGQALAMLGRTLLFEKRYSEAESESLAGYVILAKGQNQHAEWLRNARQDLAQISDALNNAAQAATFRAELAATQATDARTTKR